MLWYSFTRMWEKAITYTANKRKKLVRQRRSGSIDSSISDEGCLSYASKGLQVNYNWDFEFVQTLPKYQSIVCRHLAFAYLSLHDRKKSVHYGRAFASQRNISKSPLSKNEYDMYNFDARADQYHHFSIASNNLGLQLHALASQMRDNQTRYFGLRSDCHAMAMVLRCKRDRKGGRFVVKFYDPNNTLQHRRLVFENRDDMKRIGFAHLLTQDRIKEYFTDHRFALLAEYINPSQPSEHQPENPIVFDHELTTQSAKSLLFNAMITGNVATLKTALAYFSSLRVSKLKKLKLYQSTGCEGCLPLFVALDWGFAEAIKVYLDAIFALGLTTKQLLPVLKAVGNNFAEGGDDIMPGFYKAMLYGQLNAARVYMKMVLSCPLSDADKVNLIRAQCGSETGLLAAMESGHAELVRVYLNAIRLSTLSPACKFDAYDIGSVGCEDSLVVTEKNSRACMVYLQFCAAGSSFGFAEVLDCMPIKRGRRVLRRLAVREGLLLSSNQAASLLFPTYGKRRHGEFVEVNKVLRPKMPSC